MANSPRNQVNALLSFTDIEAGLKLLTDVFGFEEKMMYRNDDGVPEHVELGWGDSIVMPTMRKENSYWAPGPVSLFLSIDNPDEMHQKVADAGLEIIMPLTDQPYGSREFGARDDNGNVYIFGTYNAGH